MTLLTTYSIALMLGDHESQLGYEQDLDLLRQQAAMVTIHQQSEKVRKRMSCEIVEDSTGINLHLRTKYGVESMLLNAVARQCKEVIAAERQSRTSTDKGMAQYLNNIALMRTIRNCLGMSMFKSLMNSSSEISENSSNGTCSRDLEQFDQDFSELDNWSCLN